jgi:hypothetical protein
MAEIEMWAHNRPPHVPASVQQSLRVPIVVTFLVCHHQRRRPCHEK